MLAGWRTWRKKGGIVLLLPVIPNMRIVQLVCEDAVGQGQHSMDQALYLISNWDTTTMSSNIIGKDRIKTNLDLILMAVKWNKSSCE